MSFSPRHSGVTLRAESYKLTDTETMTNSIRPDHRSTNSVKLKICKPLTVMLQHSLSFKDLVQDNGNVGPDGVTCKEIPKHKKVPPLSLPKPEALFFSPRPVSELDAAATKVQKVYKSYRTRRNLADCAVVVEELWWKALDFAALKRSSVSFFNVEKPESAISRWGRARTRAAKVGKGLSKDVNAQKLALRHWLEAIDPRHRYGHNLHFYYEAWFKSESSQPFFYWLDVGDGKEVNLEKCPRTVLHRQCIKYLGPVSCRQSRKLVNTVEGSKWIFVLSTTRALYVGQKEKGVFQHSSFLAGGATTAAGRLVARNGVLEAIWPYSGHYLPTEENFREFIGFLKENHVDLVNVKRCAIDDDNPSSIESPQKKRKRESDHGIAYPSKPNTGDETDSEDNIRETTTTTVNREEKSDSGKGMGLPCKWTTGNGPRIGCVRDYPRGLQSQALQQVNLSPRVAPGCFGHNGPVPSPRPSSKVMVSPRLVYMGHPSPRTTIPATN